ncbi:EAL and HDOD domain-containing protein [Oceanirhabdus seepicola]|uniref:HDOD domain-containing protein n=1 Tax=Oceanirhabdus seepicola TaxID=2828781 RepID=A0A9J6NYG3_9CLOT|nr:HDOD domain-containing protein [Oceanirhabdus seepicola]MCM1988685.1 HDOD domain-containing protein [Oceanirhabdus seepicola]
MDKYIARQPILDKNKNVIFYEMLFRSNKENYYQAVDGNQATYDVISNTFLSIGIEKITDGKKAFINFTKELLMNETAMLLPKEYLAVEILENIEPTDEVLTVCRKLKKMGYTIVLDDFVYDSKYLSMAIIADIIKVDFIQTKGIERKRIVDKLKSYNISFLAEKVESREDFEEAVEYGYEYFQGYFFSKPEIISEHDIPNNNKINITLMQKIYDDIFDLNAIEDIIKRDLSMSYKLLKLVNSSYYGLRCEIISIKQAIMMLGIDEVRKWITLLVFKQAAEENHEALLMSTVVRARFGELLANNIELKDISSEVFLMELLSSLDVILNRPIDEILSGISVNEEIQKALNGENNILGIMHEMLNCYQCGDWTKFDIYALALGVTNVNVSEIYIEALTWVNDFDISKI